MKKDNGRFHVVFYKTKDVYKDAFLVSEIMAIYNNAFYNEMETDIEADGLMLSVAPDSSLAVIYDFNKPVGFSIQEMFKDEGQLKLYIDLICIKKEYQNKGLGDLILNKVEKKFEGICSEFVLTSVVSGHARGLYYKNNYMTKEFNGLAEVLEMVKPRDARMFAEAQVIYQVYKEMKSQGLKNVGQYVDYITKNKCFDNYYQYNLKSAEEVNDIFLKSKNMPYLMAGVQDMINNNLTISEYLKIVKGMESANDGSVSDKKFKLKRNINFYEKFNNEKFDYEKITKTFEYMELTEKDDHIHNDVNVRNNIVKHDALSKEI